MRRIRWIPPPPPRPMPSVPGYAVWLEEVMRAVMDVSGAPLSDLEWWHEIGSTSIEELANSGKFVRWDLKTGTALLNRAKGRLRQNMLLQQLNANSANDILRGRHTMKLIMQKYKTYDHAQRYYDVQDLNAVKCVKNDIVGVLLRCNTVFLRMMPETQAAYGERALLHVFYDQIKDSNKLKHEMWVFRKTKLKDSEYSRVHCIEWLREQVEDWEAEQVRLAVRSGALNGIHEDTDVPGGECSGFSHIAAPATIGVRRIKAQQKQSTQEKAKHLANVAALEAAWAQPGDPPSKARANNKARGPKLGKTPPPQGVCFDFWNHGKCEKKESANGVQMGAHSRDASLRCCFRCEGRSCCEG